jgi:tRNA threonylcarbamoyladenosine biosynthesis protein TsaB
VLLALDTATQMVGLALHDGAEVRAETIWMGGGRQTVEMAPEVALALRRQGISSSALTALAVAIGPGSYTGLRIGLALAKGIALAHNLPLIGVPTFDILARAQPRQDEPMLALIRAGRGHAAGMWYKWKASAWQPISEVVSLAWSELEAILAEPTYIVGELDGPTRAALSESPGMRLATPAQCVRRPSYLAEMAWERVRSGASGDPAAVNPIYLRPEVTQTA